MLLPPLNIPHSSGAFRHYEKDYEKWNEFSKDDVSQLIGGRNFDVMELEMHRGNVVITQKYYCAVIKDYALSFILSYSSSDDENELGRVFKTLSFTDK